MKAFLLTTLLSSAVFAANLIDGNYKPLVGERDCDLHVEMNSQGTKVFVTYITNQRTQGKCNSHGDTQIFVCDGNGRCSMGTDLSGLEVINERSLVSLWDGVKWTYADNSAIKPPNQFEGNNDFGFFAQPGRSFTGSSRCAFFAPEGYVYCDDKEYAQNVFCPKALKVARDIALEKCKKNIMKNCRITKSDTTIYNSIDTGEYVPSLQIYTFSYNNLYCMASAIAEPVK